MLDQLQNLSKKYEDLKVSNSMAAAEIAKFVIEMVPQVAEQVNEEILDLKKSIESFVEIFDRIKAIEEHNAEMMKIVSKRYQKMLNLATYPYRSSINSKDWDEVESAFSKGIFGEKVLEYIEDNANRKEEN